MELQSGIMDQWEASLVGRVVPAICEARDKKRRVWVGRAYFDSPGIDGRMAFTGDCAPGDIVNVRVISAEDGELRGEKL